MAYKNRKSKIRFFTKLMALIAIVTVLSSCGGNGGGDVSSLYGTYEGRDSYGNTICITLSSDSDNEWRKLGEDRSSNLVYTDSKGRTKSDSRQSITWTWDFDKGYVQTYYLGNKRTIIDFKHKKFYNKYGEFIDGKNGTPYTFHK